MTAVLPTAEFHPLFDDRTMRSIGVSPTEAIPISPRAFHESTMAAPGVSASHFSRWLSQEARADRWTSYGALALGLVGLVAVLFLS